MCGIAGIYGRDGAADPKTVTAMTSVLFHRGPMDSGFLLQPNVGLGMRRLSIIDVEGGKQPIYNEDHSVGVICNGEIYNYIELRQDLLKKGHHFSTNSDTEVIVHLYEDMGEQFPTALNGMFAIALWDSIKQRLILARDRLGVKPLYYFDDGKSLAFASELKSLLQCPFVPREMDRHAIAEYLTLMYIRAPRTPFLAVKKLFPGHYLLAESSGVRLVSYWDLNEHCSPSTMTEGELVEQVRQLIRDSVRLRMRSDVPVGAFLSGGIDSSTVVACAAESSDKPLKTFAVGFGGDGFDELGYASEVARFFGTDHHETIVTVDDVIQLLPRLVWHLDEPNGDSAMLPTYLVSSLAARDLRVILTGVGGDELFGGYPRYFDGYPVEHLYRCIPKPLRRKLTTPLARLLPSHMAHRALWNSLSEEERYSAEVSFLWPADMLKQLSQGKPLNITLTEEYHSYLGADSLNRLMYVDTSTYLPDDILNITDRMSMACSLEARTPFLDYRLVELCAGIPGGYKVSALHRKWKIILKKAMAPLLPSPVIFRPKWGFGAPVKSWMNQGLLPLVKGLYQQSKAVELELLDHVATQRVLEREGNRIAEPRAFQKLWMLLVLELWCRVYWGEDLRKPPTFTLRDMIK